MLPSLTQVPNSMPSCSDRATATAAGLHTPADDCGATLPPGLPGSGAACRAASPSCAGGSTCCCCCGGACCWASTSCSADGGSSDARPDAAAKGDAGCVPARLPARLLRRDVSYEAKAVAAEAPWSASSAVSSRSRYAVCTANCMTAFSRASSCGESPCRAQHTTVPPSFLPSLCCPSGAHVSYTYGRVEAVASQLNSETVPTLC